MDSSVDDLQSICIEKIIDTLKLSDIKKLRRKKLPTDMFKMIESFRSLGPSLSGRIFTHFFKITNYFCFHEDIQWFLLLFVWNMRKVTFKANHLDLSIWVVNNCKNLTELDLSIVDYLKSTSFAKIMTNLGSQLQTLQLQYSILTDDKFSKMGENLKNLVSLKIWNCKISNGKKATNFFFNLFCKDIDKGLYYDYNETLKEFYLPLLHIKSEQAYFDLTEMMLYFFLPNLQYTNLPETLADSHIVLNLIYHKGGSLNLKKFYSMSANCDISYKEVNQVLKCLPQLEEASLNLQHLKNRQKKSIIDNLNKNLTKLSITIDGHINALLYIGKRLKFINNLYVNFKGDKVNCEPSKLFDNLNSIEPIVFEHLKELHIDCEVIEEAQFLRAMLTILKGCQHTLTTLCIQWCSVKNFSEIVDFICDCEMSLDDIYFTGIDHLSDADIMKLAKLNVKGDRIFTVHSCKNISLVGQCYVANYVENINLKNKRNSFDFFYMV